MLKMVRMVLLMDENRFCCIQLMILVVEIGVGSVGVFLVLSWNILDCDMDFVFYCFMSVMCWLY